MPASPTQPGPHLGLLLLALCAPRPALAADVVLTDFAPASFDDFSVAQDLGNLLRMALEGEGLVVLSGEDLTDLVGADADTCIEEPACPGNLWDRVDAALALAGRVETTRDGALRLQLQVWDRGKDGPTYIYEEVVARGEAGHYLMGIAASLAPERGAAPEVTQVAPGVVEERYTPIGEEEERERPRRSTAREEAREEARSDAPRDLDAEEDAAAGLDLPGYARRSWADSGEPLDTWLDRARVRTRALFVEAHAGAIMGDLDRRYDTRVALYDEVGGATSERDLYSYETFLNGRGFTGGLAVGYQAAWWVDLSLLGAVQLGQKELTTGWELWEAGGGDDGQDVLLEDASKTWESVSAVIGEIQPRIRLYPLATGVLKPYGLVALDLRLYDAYTVPADEVTTYPEAGGGLGLGPTVGGGLALDAPGGVVAFAEVPWTWIVMPAGAEQRGGTRLGSVPQQFTGVGQYIVFKAGVGYHFR